MKKLALLILCTLFIGVQFSNAQTKNITGKVISAEDGTSIPGVSVLVKGTTIGTITNVDGDYTLQVPDDAKVLTFSFVGLKTVDVPISGNTVNATMEADVLGLDEVMVVAFGTAKKESLTGSAAVIGEKQIESRSVSSVAQVLTGSTTGIQTTAGSGRRS